MFLIHISDSVLNIIKSPLDQIQQYVTVRTTGIRADGVGMLCQSFCNDALLKSRCTNPAVKVLQKTCSCYEACPAVPYSAASYSPVPSSKARYSPSDHCEMHTASHTHSGYKYPFPTHLPNSAFQMHRSSPPHNPE